MAGEAEAEDGARAGEDQAFREQLAHDAGAACAESAAHGELLGAGGGAGQQQVGEIDAGDEQNDADRGPENDERTAQLAADVVLERHGDDTAILGVVAAGLRDICCSSTCGARRQRHRRCAWASVTPGLRRPMKVMMLPQSRGGP